MVVLLCVAQVAAMYAARSRVRAHTARKPCDMETEGQAGKQGRGGVAGAGCQKRSVWEKPQGNLCLGQRGDPHPETERGRQAGRGGAGR